MIRRGLIKRKSQELLKGDPVIDLGFQFRIGINMESLLNQEALEQKQRRISGSAFNIFTNAIMFQKQAFDRRPVNNGIDFFHTGNGTVMFQESINPRFSISRFWSY